jgi:hypothetical protein
MKTTFKVLIAIFAVGAVILLGLHLFLQYGLTKSLREVVLPRVKAETGIDVRVGGLSINVASGLLYLKEVEVKNPDGFLFENLASIARVTIEVDIPSLFGKKLILVKNVAVESALVNVIRNKAGEININTMQEALPQPAEPRTVPDIEKPPTEKIPETGTPEPAKPKPLPEILIEAMQGKATVRYVDFKLNQLDIALDLNVVGSNLSTLRDPAAPWGDIAVIGSLGNDRTSFVTDLKARLAPLIDLQAPTFDLAGKVLEIDPRLMAEAYSKLGIRSAPFGLSPDFHCRGGWFHDSSVALNLVDIVFEDKLVKRLGGMGSIGALRFPVPVEGSLQQPTVNVQKALSDAIGGNAQTLLESFLKGAAAKEIGLDEPPEDLADAAVEMLGKQIGEIGESETVKKMLKDLAGGGSSDTNAPSPINSDALIDILGEQVEEIGGNEELKKELKNLGKFFFGK